MVLWISMAKLVLHRTRIGKLFLLTVDRRLKSRYLTLSTVSRQSNTYRRSKIRRQKTALVSAYHTLYNLFGRCWWGKIKKIIGRLWRNARSLKDGAIVLFSLMSTRKISPSSTKQTKWWLKILTRSFNSKDSAQCHICWEILFKNRLQRRWQSSLDFGVSWTSRCHKTLSCSKLFLRLRSNKSFKKNWKQSADLTPYWLIPRKWWPKITLIWSSTCLTFMFSPDLCRQENTLWLSVRNPITTLRTYLWMDANMTCSQLF